MWLWCINLDYDDDNEAAAEGAEGDVWIMWQNPWPCDAKDDASEVNEWQGLWEHPKVANTLATIKFEGNRWKNIYHIFLS